MPKAKEIKPLTIPVFNQTMRHFKVMFAGMRIPWFLCFGTILHFIRDKDLTKDHDVDVGILYEHMEEKKILTALRKFSFDIKLIIRNDTNGKPLYIRASRAGGCPVCIFTWIRRGKVRYHTFDTNHEGRERPKRYKFLGVPAYTISGKDAIRNIDFGAPYISDIPMPIRYGQLLDIWYPNWLVEQKGVTSTSKWIQEVTSVNQLK